MWFSAPQQSVQQPLAQQPWQYIAPQLQAQTIQTQPQTLQQNQTGYQPIPPWHLAQPTPPPPQFTPVQAQQNVFTAPPTPAVTRPWHQPQQNTAAIYQFPNKPELEIKPQIDTQHTTQQQAQQ
jgi:hypothetical protein